MSKNNCQRKKLKIPESFGGILINYCKNSKCLNFGSFAEIPEVQKNNEKSNKDQKRYPA